MHRLNPSSTLPIRGTQLSNNSKEHEPVCFSPATFSESIHLILRLTELEIVMARLSPREQKIWEVREAALTVRYENFFAYDCPLRQSSEVQLLTLFPSESEVSELQAKLNVANLQPTPPKYEALSYVWKVRPEYSPFVGLEAWPLRIGTTKFKVSRCLANVLFHLRHRAEPRALWIDSISIDQSSVREKNHQVRQMYNAYAVSHRAVILAWRRGWQERKQIYGKAQIEARVPVYAVFADLTRILVKNMVDSYVVCCTKYEDCKMATDGESHDRTLQEGLAAPSNSVVYIGAQEVAWEDMLAAMHHALQTANRALLRAQNQELESILGQFGRVHRLRQKGEHVILEDLI